MKKIIQGLLRPFGYRLQNLKKLGCSPWRDIQILLQSIPNPVCFDIGAHRGETTKSIIEHFPGATIYAFEPDPENFAVLQEETKSLPQAKIYPLAMSDHAHQAKLLKTAFSMSNSLLPASPALHSESHRKIGEVEITVTTLDQFCHEHAIESIDFLKIDCQGLDLKVMKGASKLLSEHRAKVIQCESLFILEYEGQGWFYEILHFLTDMGYAPVSFCEPTRNAHHEAIWSDVIFKAKS